MEKHCGHECNGEVCARYSLQGSPGFPCSANNGEHSTVGKPCQHDTRQRNVPEGLEAASTDELIGELSKREGVLIVGNYPKGAKLGYLTTKKPTMLIAVVKGEKP